MMEDLEQVYPFPPLTEEEFAELKEDIAERGVQVPIEVDESGKIIDGWHRLQACLELGITDIPTICREGWSEQEKRTQAIKLNMARRHLTREQKRDLIRELIKESPERSDRQIADELGVHHTTVGTVRKDLVNNGDVANLATSVDSLGREQPRQRKPLSIEPAMPETDYITEPPYQEAESDYIKASTPAQNHAEPESITGEEAYGPPHTTTPDEDLLIGLQDQTDWLRRGLQVIIDDYCLFYKTKECMPFSDDVLAAALERLDIMKEVVDEFEEFIRNRRKQYPEPG